jgi:PAS domain S-box-containing protein
MGEHSQGESSPQSDLDARDAASTRSIAENSPDNIMLLDREARIRYINFTVPDLSREAVYGTLVYEFVPAEFRDAMRHCFERVLATGKADRYETSYISKDGDISVWESRVGAVMRGGEVAGFAVISSNVSERRKAAADRDRFFNLSLDMLCVASGAYFTRINPAWRRVLGYTEEELLARSFLDFVHPEDHAATLARVEELEAGIDVVDFENRYRRKDGNYRWFSWRAVWDPDRRVIHAIARDVTEQRQLQAQLRHSQKMDAIGQLAAGIAHDFNNLILVIGVNVELASDTTDAKQRGAYLMEISKAAQRARDLTRQLLAFGRHSLMRPAAVNVAEVAHGLAKMLRPLLPANVELALEIGSELAPVEGDPGQLEQVILNLCLNARDALPDGGRIALLVDATQTAAMRQLSVPSSDTAHYVRIAVEDNGIGMSAEVKERLFEPFFTTKPAGKGTGLGLSTAYGIVQGHGGFMRVESELGRGSRIEAYLPAALGASIEAVEPAEDEGVAAKGETLLVAEDDDSVREVVVDMLERAGYRVLTAPDGERAVAMFREHQAVIDLVLLDVVMPKLSGPDAFEEMRAIKPSLRAVFTSGYADAANFRAVRLTGAPLVPKPYERAALLRSLRRALH